MRNLLPAALQPAALQPAACSLQPCNLAACSLARCGKDSKLTRADKSRTRANVGLQRPSLLQPCSPAPSNLGRRHWPKAFKYCVAPKHDASTHTRQTHNFTHFVTWHGTISHRTCTHVVRELACLMHACFHVLTYISMLRHKRAHTQTQTRTCTHTHTSVRSTHTHTRMHTAGMYSRCMRTRTMALSSIRCPCGMLVKGSSKAHSGMLVKGPNSNRDRINWVGWLSGRTSRRAYNPQTPSSKTRLCIRSVAALSKVACRRQQIRHRAGSSGTCAKYMDVTPIHP